MTASVAARITRTEVRRSLRAVAGNRTKVAIMALVLLFVFGPFTAVGLFFLPEAGEQVAAGALSDVGGVSVGEIATGATALVWLGLTLTATGRTATARGDVDEPACLLISTSTRSVAAGLIGTELALYALTLLPFVALFAGAFAYGAGSVVPLAVALVVVALLLVTSIPVGFVVGLAIRHLLTTYEPVARYKRALFVLFWGAYFGAVMTDWFDRIVAVLFERLANSPFGWPGELLLFAVPGYTPRTVALVGTALVVGIGLPLVLVASTAMATRHWFADEASADESTANVSSSGRLDALFAGVGDRALRAVAVTTLRRAKRAPIKMLYVVYPLFGFLAFIQEIIKTGTVSPVIAVVLCGYVVWASGALLTLNVLGDHGRTLPTLLTTSVSGRQAVGGMIIAAVLVVAPLAAVLSAALGLASPLPPRETAFLVAATVFGAVATPAIATGIGALFPRFGSVRVSSNREAVMPSKSAFVTYTLVLVAPIAAALVLYTDSAGVVAGIASAVVTFVTPLEVTISAGVVTAIAWLTAVLGVSSPVLSFGYAARAFDRFTLE
ncbi:hypothetical protein [Halovivax asiaticus]|uniref:hypothetical protein n=1 Tax=Halovivax asiaticus TaxID=332953 RepID=UPI00126758F3|nr:hypothetical protein [Halovivax asiaticus]